jgi:hypothetical protein
MKTLGMIRSEQTLNHPDGVGKAAVRMGWPIFAKKRSGNCNGSALNLPQVMRATITVHLPSTFNPEESQWICITRS